MKIFDEVQNGLLEALKKSARELKEQGFAQACEIAKKSFIPPKEMIS